MDAAVVQWIVGCAGACVVANQVLRFIKDHIREQPRPSDVYATKKEHGELKKIVSQFTEQTDDRFQTYEAKLEQAIKEMELRRSANVARLHDKIEEMGNTLRRDVHEDVKSLHRRIDPILGLVSKLSGKLDQ